MAHIIPKLALSRCCEAPAVWTESYVSERSGIEWQALICSKCKDQLFRTMVRIADQKKFQEFLKAQDS